MPVLVTSNFDDDSIKNEQGSMETVFSHCKSMGNFLDAQGLLTRYLQVYKGSDQKQPRKDEAIIFPIVSEWGLSVAMETKVLIQSTPKSYAAFPLPQ